jgi:hypothetical protein
VGTVDDGAVGRKAYADRTPPVPGERTQCRDESVRIRAPSPEGNP